MISLVPGTSIKDLQAYVEQVEMKRGFADESIVQKCLLLGEEVGELFKAIRRTMGIGVDPTAKTHEAAEELADVLIFVVAIANRMNVDLESALREKEEKNRSRVWR